MSLSGRRRPLAARFSLSAPFSTLKAFLRNSASVEGLWRYRLYVLAGWLALIVGGLVLLLGSLSRGVTADANSRPLADRSLAVIPPTRERSLQPATATPSQEPAVVQAGAQVTDTSRSTPSATATATPDVRPTTQKQSTVTSRPTASVTLTPQPTSTPVLAGSQCGPPGGWMLYTVRAGDNLYRISLRSDVTLGQMRQANCLSGDAIYAGQQIYVPITIEPSPTLAPTATPTPPPPTPEPATSTPVPTATQLPPTATPDPTPTATDVPATATPLPSPTSSPTPTPALILKTPPATPNS